MQVKQTIKWLAEQYSVDPRYIKKRFSEIGISFERRSPTPREIRKLLDYMGAPLNGSISIK